MSLSREEAQELAAIIHARSGQGRVSRPKFRVIEKPRPSLLDSLSREAHIRRILWLRKRYGLTWLLEQACFNAANVYELDDAAVIALLQRMEKARECIADGISFEDAGLVQSVFEDQGIRLSSRDADRQADIAAMRTVKEASAAATRDDDDSPF